MEKIEICDVFALVVESGIEAFPAGAEVVRRNPVPIVVGVHEKTRGDLLMPGKAVSLFGPPPGLVERRQQHGGEDRDDCNNDKKFD